MGKTETQVPKVTLQTRGWTGNRSQVARISVQHPLDHASLIAFPGLWIRLNDADSGSECHEGQVMKYAVKYLASKKMDIWTFYCCIWSGAFTLYFLLTVESSLEKHKRLNSALTYISTTFFSLVLVNLGSQIVTGSYLALCLGRQCLEPHLLQVHPHKSNLS